jgi:predicted Zn-dependent peptidase
MRNDRMKSEGERLMKIPALISITMRRTAFAALILAALAGSGAPVATGQEKSTPMGKVERLNRAPVSKEILRVELPRPTIVKLKNGLTLLLLENHKLPTVAFSLWIRPGQLADPNDLPGLASFTAGMLREGTERRTSVQIANETDSLGASLNANSAFGVSYTSVNASGLINDAPQILDLLSDVVLHPSFPAGELAQYKQREEASLEQRLSNPGFLAQQAFRRVIYGDAPLGIGSATRESIAKVTREDLKKFHDQHYRPGNSILGVTGDFKTADMQALVEKYFGEWTGAAEPAISMPKTMTPQPSKITLVDRPDSVQTFVIGGDRAIRRTDPDYYALTVMNQVIGGGPQARLFLDLREVHGYTYGVYSRFNAEVYQGDWAASGSVRTPVTDGSMTQLIYEFKLINSEPVPQSELDDARRAIVAGFALSLEQPAQVLNDWLTVEYYGLPADYWDKYSDRVAAVDAAAVQAAAKKYVDLAHLQWVCVGDRKQIQDVLAKYGPVAVMDVEGKPEK